MIHDFLQSFVSRQIDRKTTYVCVTAAVLSSARFQVHGVKLSAQLADD